jgi:PAS domain S-box-containing protein
VSEPTQEADVPDAPTASPELVLRALDSSDDAIFIVDEPSGLYVYVNEGATRLVGYSRRALLRMGPSDLDAAFALVGFEDRMGYAQVGAAATFNAELLRSDGVLVPVECTLQRTAIVNGRKSSIVIVARDITGRIQAAGAARRDDRERIANELQGTAIHLIFEASLLLHGAQQTAAGPTGTRIAAAVDALDTAIDRIRAAVFELRATPSPQPSLQRELLRVVDDFERPGLVTTVQFSGPVDRTAPDTAADVLAVLRRALRAVGHVTTLQIELTAAGGLTLAVLHDRNVLGLDALEGPSSRVDAHRCIVNGSLDGGSSVVARWPTASMTFVST